MAPAFDRHVNQQMNGLATLNISDKASPVTSPAPSRSLRFCVTAATHFGQHVALAHTTCPQTKLCANTVTDLAYEHPGVWTLTLPSVKGNLRYKYVIKHADDSAQPVWEAGPDRLLETHMLPSLAGKLLVRDEWRANPDASRDIFSTAAFTRVLFRRDAEVGAKLFESREHAAFSDALVQPRGSFVVTFRVFVERVGPCDRVCVLGDIDELGNDDPSQAVPLADVSAPVWQRSIAISKFERPLHYRFVIQREDGSIVHDQKRHELNINHLDREFLQAESGTASVVFAPAEHSFVFETRWRGAGIALPVFSIRSKRSCGIGEFTDLIEAVDLCKQTGYHLLQLLPINDTNVYNTARDSYPYSAVSSFALHPQYLNIDQLGTMPEELQKEYDSERQRLNRLETVDVVQVMRVKTRFIREMFKIYRDEFLLSTEFTDWFKKHQAWLVPYALFRFFMLINGTAEFDQWGIRSTFSRTETAAFADPSSFHFDHLAMVYFTQFHLHKQLTAAADYATTKGVVFKGDLPIGVNRYCTDTWVNPHLFRLTMQAGVPPDYFSEHGQNWSFPTYDWKAMSKDNYGWWRARLGHMANYFHAYRIDHILGFFRIWEIPECFRTGMSGRFFPAHGISRQELESLGLWDMDRYTKPYVHDGILQGIFNEDWWKVKERFFEPLYANRLQFKKAYNTEKKTELALKLPTDAPQQEQAYNESVTKKLYTLFNNVCLLQDVDDENIFHPRFMMETTSSYQELPSEEWKRALFNLQDDYMNHRQNELWKNNALERLPMMKAASDMLVCGEDLGFIPDCVPDVMTETSIVSLAVQRMPASEEGFGIPSDYKYECVATTSSHDTSTFRGWWEEIGEEMRKSYWTDVMHRNAHEQPPADCTPELVEWAIADHLQCPAMWTIFPLQDLLGMSKELRRANAAAEQINDPSDPEHIWCFRLHIDIETILKDKPFIEKLVMLNEKHGRGSMY